LYGAVFSGQLRTLFAQSWSPAEILRRANSSLIAHYQVSNYIAVACLRIQSDHGACTLANGGMPFPYLVSKGEVARIPVSGVPLGLIEGTTYDELPFSMEKGDVLILTSDGTTDAMNPEGEMFEERRFIESIQHHAAEGVAQLTKSLYNEICEFTRSADVHDDITILALSRTV
jgi:sigma-B regulation protein RsbU (phosphoserine phosphatase)